ncbi:TetR/AcrR family transcriptional regulator [Pseudoclavibacter sp. 13-3]|uniref:TetR/AcrR family transcriptional regulator n=1 Tax=Pseudoclavibacter sp. 13-3 TaxID=2901228 RepID=UPI001E4B20A6|nr:TetR/AcrR family transcriptional regulator [Pseudoclavibacter sp. 13-3]MCD7100938.1 TetR/AcrR family transcriptional regulator [Pseudoclavibacter sp. 13-3]
MARRLSLEARRSEILQRTRQMIAEQGPEGLSLRAVARWCGMSAPGLLHHFDGLKPLLEAVLRERAEDEMAAYTAALPANPTLRDWADTVARVAMTRVEENRNFDALETQAIANPDHPAHDFYLMETRPFAATITLAEEEYPRNPQLVTEVLSTVVDGLRMHWLRSREAPNYFEDWQRVADTVFAGFEQYRA